jgi:hypothetical protein
MAGFKTQTTDDGNGVQVLDYSVGEIDFWNFGNTSGSHIRAGNYAIARTATSYTISGGASRHWELGNLHGSLLINETAITLSGTPDFSSEFAEVGLNSVVSLNGATFTGAATGKRYSVGTGGILNANGQTLPGDSAGTGTDFGTDPWGLYLA